MHVPCVSFELREGVRATCARRQRPGRGAWRARCVSGAMHFLRSLFESLTVQPRERVLCSRAVPRPRVCNDIWFYDCGLCAPGAVLAVRLHRGVVIRFGFATMSVDGSAPDRF